MQLGRADEAVAVHQDMVARFGDDTLAAFDDIASRLRDDADPNRRSQALAANVNKAGILAALDRRNQARAALTDLVTRFETDQDEPIQALLAQAREQLAAMLDAPITDDDAD